MTKKACCAGYGEDFKKKNLDLNDLISLNDNRSVEPPGIFALWSMFVSVPIILNRSNSTASTKTKNVLLKKEEP